MNTVRTASLPRTPRWPDAAALVCVVACAVAIAQMLLSAGATWMHAAVVALALIAGLAAWMGHRRHAAALRGQADAARAEALAAVDARLAGLRDAAKTASGRLGEVWSDLIEVARSETEGSITELTQRFGHIVVSLDQSIQVANSALNGDAIAAVEEHGRAELAGLIQELRESCRREQVMRERVEALAGRIEQLRTGADSVQAVAKSATLLSLNAAIEAARAGNSGSGFSVVAAEMQRLSQASGELGERMAATSNETIASISEAVDAVRESVQASEAAATAAEQRVARVLDEYAGLTQRISASGAALAREARDVNESVSAALVSLQFQDRTSQILCHVRDSVKRAPSSVFAADGAGRMDPDGELDELSRSYATQQERDVHAGRAAAASTAGDITFF